MSKKQEHNGIPKKTYNTVFCFHMCVYVYISPRTFTNKLVSFFFFRCYKSNFIRSLFVLCFDSFSLLLFFQSRLIALLRSLSKNAPANTATGRTVFNLEFKICGFFGCTACVRTFFVCVRVFRSFILILNVRYVYN